MNDNMVTV